MRTIQVSTEAIKDIAYLKDEWENLFIRSNKAPFLNWHWISSYFAELDGRNCYFIAARKNKKLVGAALLLVVKRGIKQYAYLNRFGNPTLDQPWIEYNDFLIQQEDEKAIRLALIEHCVEKLCWHELIVGASVKEALAPYSLFALNRNTIWYSHTYQTRLKEFTSGKDYLSSLSRNTRYQINRSIREYEKYGAIKFNVAQTSDEALAWFEESAPHHIARWEDTDVGSGFTNPSFVSFHRRYIEDAFQHGSIDLIKVTAGNKIISYLYNFKEQETIYFYLSSNVYDKSLAHTKPGLVSHYLAISHYIQQGKSCYDFMGGESQYKRSLSNQCSPILINSYTRKSVKTKLEHHLRFLKHLFQSHRAEKHCNLKDTQLIITGGTLNTSARPQYGRAIAIKVLIDSSGKLTELDRLSYSPPKDAQSKDTNILFKSGHISDKSLWVTTETEVKQVDVESMQITNTYSYDCFNDLHHVIQHNECLYIANTGLDSVVKLSLNDEKLISYPIVSNATSRSGLPVDLRSIPSTKPHLAHPNYCFMIDGEAWVTRCDFMDAVCVNNPDRRIFIGDGLVHDGVVKGKYVYFTTVNGRIKIFDKKTLQLCSDIDLAIVAPHWKGWFRGITPVTSGLVLIGMSKPRPSKRSIKISQQSALLLVDIFSNEVLQNWDLGHLGLDAVFSVLEAPKT